MKAYKVIWHKVELNIYTGKLEHFTETFVPCTFFKADAEKVASDYNAYNASIHGDKESNPYCYAYATAEKVSD